MAEAQVQDAEIVRYVEHGLAFPDDPGATMTRAQALVAAMSEQCDGPKFVAEIQGRRYPKVEWWTSVGATLGIFPREVSARPIIDWKERHGYEATVELVRESDGAVLGRGTAICTQSERRWSNADEYAVRSMAVTRATGKAYRLAMSFLTVLAGLEPTSAEEMPADGGHQEPPRQQAPASSPKAPAASSTGLGPNDRIISVAKVEIASSGEKNGRAWKLYAIVDGESGESFATFSESDAEIAHAGMERGVRVKLRIEQTARGSKVAAIRLLTPEDGIDMKSRIDASAGDGDYYPDQSEIPF